MDTIIAVPILFLTLLIQITAVSRLPLLHGNADLVLLTLIAWGICAKSKNAWIWALIGGLMTSFVSAVPGLAIIIPYIVVAIFAQILHNRLSQSPILAMLIITILGSFMVQLMTMALLNIKDISVEFALAFEAILIPSLILNLFLSLPVYLYMKDISRWVYPKIANE
jgi:hypothetical protein